MGLCVQIHYSILKKVILNKFYELLVPEGKILFILLSWQGEWFQKEPLNENLLTFVNFYSMNEFSEILNKVWFSVIYENIETVNNSWELWHNKMVFIAKKTSSKSNYQNEQSTSPWWTRTEKVFFDQH